MYLRMFLAYSSNAKDSEVLTIYIPKMLAHNIYYIYCLQK